MRSQGDVIEAAERYRILSFTRLEPIVIVEGRGHPSGIWRGGST